MDILMKKDMPSKILQKSQPVQYTQNSGIPERPKKDHSPVTGSRVFVKDDATSLRDAAAAVHQIKLNAQRELEQARKMRSDAHKYQQDTANRARSDAQQLILRTRLATQRETEELIRQSSEEIQKVLADIRMIRIMAQEELAAQRKFTDAARLRTMSMAIQNELEKPDLNKKERFEAIT
jgi:hypothetical protein